MSIRLTKRVEKRHRPGKATSCSVIAYRLVEVIGDPDQELRAHFPWPSYITVHRHNAHSRGVGSSVANSSCHRSEGA